MSLRKAIDLKCKECLYDPIAGHGSWREQIAQCTSVDCPIWPVRPGPGSGPFVREVMDDRVREKWGGCHGEGA